MRKSSKIQKMTKKGEKTRLFGMSLKTTILPLSVLGKGSEKKTKIGHQKTRLKVHAIKGKSK